jgi:hypothetical protein
MRRLQIAHALWVAGVVPAFLEMTTDLRGQTPWWEIDGDPTQAVAFGSRVESVGDIDDDGCDDIVVTDVGWKDATHNAAGAFYVYSGKTQAFLWGQTGSESLAYWGEGLASLGDLDGDGYREFAITSEKGHVDVFSPRTNRLLYSVPIGRGNIPCVANAGDIDLDGVTDLAIGDGTNTYLYSGSTGNNLAKWSVRAWSVDGAGDVDGDGVPDLVIGDPLASPNGGVLNGRVLVYSGKDASLLREIDGVGDGRLFGSAVRGGSDFDQDGVPDLLICNQGNGPNSAFLFLYSGATGSELTHWDGGGKDRNLAIAGDLDGDGTDDFLRVNGSLRVMSGRTWLEMSTLPGFHAVGRCDVNGDGRLDVLVGDNTHPPVGAVFAYPGAIPPTVTAVQPARADFATTSNVTVTGSMFQSGGGTQVLFGGAPATNVLIQDDATITCTTPVGAPGPVDVTVTNTVGSGSLAGGFTFTPAVAWSGNASLGGKVTIEYLCQPLDGVFAIAGLPPAVSVPTPPFTGALSIAPFSFLFLIPTHFLTSDEVTLDGTIPNDPSLSGTTLLLQALIGPSFVQPKDACWTNCASLTIQ